MKNKKILAIDTSDNICSVCIKEKDFIIKKSISNKSNHSETLMPLIESCFLESSFKASELDLILVTDGPGSFTGIRIGVSTAKALAHFKNIPILPIKSLDNIASFVTEQDKIIVPLIDARRDTFYTVFYQNSFKEPITEIMHIEIAEILELLKEYNKEIVLVGDKLNELLKNTNIDEKITILDISNQIERAENMTKISEYFSKEENFKTYKNVEPFYLKKSQAEREYDEKIAKGKL